MAKHTLEEKDCIIMLSDVASSAKYPEVKKSSRRLSGIESYKQKGLP